MSKLDREESLTRKFSIIHFSKKLFEAAVNALEENPSRANPVPTKKGIITKVKNLITDEIRSLWNDKVKDLIVQGKFLHPNRPS